MSEDLKLPPSLNSVVMFEVAGWEFAIFCWSYR